MIRFPAALAFSVPMLALAACQQPAEQPVEPPPPEADLQAPADLVIPPEEIEAPPPVGHTDDHLPPDVPPPSPPEE